MRGGLAVALVPAAVQETVQVEGVALVPVVTSSDGKTPGAGMLGSVPFGDTAVSLLRATLSPNEDVPVAAGGGTPSSVGSSLAPVSVPVPTPPLVATSLSAPGVVSRLTLESDGAPARSARLTVSRC